MASLDWRHCPVVESIPGRGERRVGFEGHADAGFDLFLTTGWACAISGILPVVRSRRLAHNVV
jgi:hypothetical protein